MWVLGYPTFGESWCGRKFFEDPGLSETLQGALEPLPNSTKYLAKGDLVPAELAVGRGWRTGGGMFVVTQDSRKCNLSQAESV